MIGGSILNVLPKGFFSWPLSSVEGCVGESSLDMVVDEEKGRKRPRCGIVVPDYVAACRTPTLISADRKNAKKLREDRSDGNDRPTKRFRGITQAVYFPEVTATTAEPKQKQKCPLLSTVPGDVVEHCLSFLGTSEDRFALQSTCKTFRDITNSEEMLAKVDVCGNVETGKRGIIVDDDTPDTASERLAPFARAGNLEALYLLGIVKCYCYQDLKNGIVMLKMSAEGGFIRSSYTLGIILRDALPEDASQYMNSAAAKGYVPALQELLSASEMKRQVGEPNADELRRHLDPICLNRLLLRNYVGSAELRGLNTSHCWNPLCGKWAYKATNTNSAAQTRRPMDVTYDLEGEADPPSNLVVSPSHRGRRSMAVLVDGHGVHGTHHRRITTRSMVATNATSQSVAPKLPSQATAWTDGDKKVDRVSRMKMCSRCCRAKYCSKLCQVYDWRSTQHKMECQFL